MKMKFLRAVRGIRIRDRLRSDKVRRDLACNQWWENGRAVKVIWMLGQDAWQQADKTYLGNKGATESVEKTKE